MRNGTAALITRPALLAELSIVLQWPKLDVIFLRSNSSRAQAMAQVHQLGEVVEPPPLARPVCRDPDDDAVLALALAAQADMVVSGDDDLLSLGNFEAIPILTPVQALGRVLAALNAWPQRRHN
ncbi:MAG: putative toxin-antitoxin system toxin component, PIN family [Burkholderiaceae bacterium]|nr:putative toxin-antitoxin system toxin component, PIN family [Burkholderiaceae bacterium]